MKSLRAFRIVLVTMATVSVCAALGETGFMSRPAKTAETNYARALTKARDEYLTSLNRALAAAGEAKDSEEVTRIAAEIERLKNVSVESNPPANLKPGMWITRYANGVPGTIEAQNDGRVLVSINKQDAEQSNVQFQDGVAVVQHRIDHSIERWSIIAGGRLLIEHWDPPETFETNPEKPRTLGIAVWGSATR